MALPSNLHRWLLGIAITCPLAGSAFAAAAPPDLNETVSLVPTEYRHKLVQRLSLAEENRDQLLTAIAKADPARREAIAFLILNMPEHDLKGLTADYLVKNVDLAYEARAATPWAAAVPQEIFLNDVVPYANLNEKREDWRTDFRKRFGPLVKDCKSAGDAAQLLNREVFKTLNVKYHATKRNKPDQSPSESCEIGFASCSGLSIILADACRAVGVPARVAGTAVWSDHSGNHTWVEVWDGQWRFVGAAEPGKFNETWFAGNAAKADDSKVEERVYAASFKQTGMPFILIWDPTSTEYPAVDMTGYYVKREPLKVAVTDAAGKPVSAKIQVRSGDELIAEMTGETASFEFAADADYTVTALVEGGAKATAKTHLGRDAAAEVAVKMPAK